MKGSETLPLGLSFMGLFIIFFFCIVIVLAFYFIFIGDIKNVILGIFGVKP